jgi:hypothetical protein
MSMCFAGRTRVRAQNIRPNSAWCKRVRVARRKRKRAQRHRSRPSLVSFILGFEAGCEFGWRRKVRWWSCPVVRPCAISASANPEVPLATAVTDCGGTPKLTPSLSSNERTKGPKSV